MWSRLVVAMPCNPADLDSDASSLGDVLNKGSGRWEKGFEGGGRWHMPGAEGGHWVSDAVLRAPTPRYSSDIGHNFREAPPKLSGRYPRTLVYGSKTWATLQMAYAPRQATLRASNVLDGGVYHLDRAKPGSRRQRILISRAIFPMRSAGRPRPPRRQTNSKQATRERTLEPEAERSPAGAKATRPQQGVMWSAAPRIVQAQLQLQDAEVQQSAPSPQRGPHSCCRRIFAPGLRGLVRPGDVLANGAKGRVLRRGAAGPRYRACVGRW